MVYRRGWDIVRDWKRQELGGKANKHKHRRKKTTKGKTRSLYVIRHGERRPGEAKMTPESGGCLPWLILYLDEKRSCLVAGGTHSCRVQREFRSWSYPLYLKVSKL